MGFEFGHFYKDKQGVLLCNLEKTLETYKPCQKKIVHTHTHLTFCLKRLRNLLVLSCLINPSDLFGENFCIIMDLKLCNIFFNLTKMGISQEDFTSYIG